MKFLATILFLITVSASLGQNKYFVSTTGSNSNNGLTTSNAFSTIQFAINTAQSGDSIIVASGTYLENINFSGKNVKVCSNFIYSGDSTVISSTKIDGGANGFPVVKFVTGEGPTAQLNGFTIQNGLVALSLTAAGIQVHGFGTSPTLKNLIIKNNTLINQGEGAGMTVFNTEAVTTIQNIKFLNNVSSNGVGGLKVHAGNISMTNVEFRNNSGYVSAFARSIGAGSFDNYFYPLRNILIANNSGSLCVSGSGLVFMNTTIANNSGGIVLAGNSALLNCIVASGHTITNQGILAIENSLIKDGASSVINPIAAMLTYQDNLSGSIFFNSSNYKLQSYSPAIAYGQDQFQYFTQTYKSALFDIENQARDTVGTAAVDLGCYENLLTQVVHNNKIYVSPTVTNSETVGLISSPFASIQSAVDYSFDNDSIILMQGTYTENVLCGKTVHFKGQNGAANTIWQHNDMQNYLLTVFHPTWDNVNLKTPSVTSIKFIKNLGIVYNGNTHGLRAQQAAKLTVNKCWFEDIRIASTTYYGHFVFNNSVFYNIELIAMNDAGYTEVDRLPQFRFCTIVNSQVLTAGSPAIYPTFSNCIITKTTPQTTSYFQGTQPLLTKVYIDQSVTSQAGSISTVIPNILHLGFVNPALKDFHLKNSSPAIGYGAVLSGLTQDFDGQSRPQFSFPDIGAFEHINNSSSNAAPFLIQPSSLSFLEDQPVVLSLTGIDDGDFFQTQTLNLTATSTNSSIVATPTLTYTPSQTTGTISFIPNLNSNGIAPIVVKLKDNGGILNNGLDSIIYTLNVNVLSINDAPVASNDVATTNEDTPATINLLANDSDVDNAIVSNSVDLNLSSSGVQSTFTNSQGVWTANTSGVLTFTPALNYNGTASISYKVYDDSLALSNAATISITVVSINDAPVAVNNTASTNEDTPISLNILTNDSDVDNAIDSSSVDLNLTLAGTQNTLSVSNGTWSINTSGLLTLTPALNFNGVLTLDYKVKDVLGLLSNTATVTINVIAVNDAPVSVNDTLITAEDQATSFNLLINDYDVDNALAPTTVDLNVINPGVQTANVSSAGSWSVNTVGLLTFTPAANYFGQATLNYSVKDASGLVSNTAQIIVVVSPVNDAPVAVNNSGLTTEDNPINLNILTNDTDIDNLIDSTSVDFDFVTVGNQSSFTNTTGSWNVNTHGVLTFTPTLNFNGNATINSTVSDQSGLTSNTALITISVTAVNDAPTANNDSLTTNEDVSATINLLTNDLDVDNAIATNTIDLNPSVTGVQNSFIGPNGTFSVTSTGILTFNPAANFNGSASTNYTVKDISGAISNTATIYLTVNPINDVPLATNNAATTNEDTPVSINILLNDTDIENQLDSTSVDLNLSLIGIQSTVQTNSGNWSVANNGLLTFVPLLNFNGTASIQYQVKDLQGLTSNSASVNITVNPINDAPDSVLISVANINENLIATIGLLSTQDVDSNQVFTYSLVSGIGSTHNSSFNIVNNELHNTVSFNYELLNLLSIRVKTTDQGGLSKEQIFLITVNNINDIQATDTTNDTYCNGIVANGAIDVTVGQTNGLVSYSWTGPNSFSSTTQDINGLESGNYVLTITDALDTAVFNFFVNQIPTYDDLGICYVTGDTMPGNHNRLYFNNPNMYNVQYYQILRESTVQGVYDFIGQVTPQDTSFLDLVSNNQAQSFSYKVRAIDSCGNFSNESTAHTTMLLQANLSSSNSVNLTWTPYSGAGYTSYYLYKSINGGIFDLLVTLPASQLSFNDVTANVTTNQYLYFVSIVVPNCDFTKSNNNVRSNIKYLTDGGVGIQDISDIQLVQVSPNPSTGIFEINMNNFDEIDLVKLFDSKGQEVQVLNSNIIDIEAFADGVYFLELTFKNGFKIQKKLVKNN
jgi:hypothetical protein